jgi:hypothetical protein
VQPTLSLDGHSHFNTKRANWPEFRALTEKEIDQDNSSVEEVTALITETIITAAIETIPRTSGKLGRPPVPWWNNECDDAKRERVRAERAMKRNNTDHSRTRYSRARAKCKVVYDRSYKTSWRNMLSSINSRTSINSVWKKVQKLNKRYKMTPTPNLKNNCVKVTDPWEVGEVFCRYNNQMFHRHKTELESLRMNMEGAGNEYYNLPFQSRELTHALKQCNESSPGDDEITYSMIRNSHPLQECKIKF